MCKEDYSSRGTTDSTGTTDPTRNNDLANTLAMSAIFIQETTDETRTTDSGQLLNHQVLLIGGVLLLQGRGGGIFIQRTTCSTSITD